MDYIDKQFAKRGYKLVRQNEYGAYYERKDNKFNYTSELCIIAKAMVNILFSVMMPK